ncbi:hypothetical protein VW012_15495 [Phaeobacter sp. JH209B]
MSKEIAEFSFDLHSGLSSLTVPEFDQLPILGMCATLAVHIKGLGAIEYEVLRKVSDHFMSIPSYALRQVVEVLEEIGFLTIVSRGRTIEKILPNIPVFDNVYEGLGEFASNEISFNEHEAATVEILSALYDAPRSRDSLLAKSGIDKLVFDRCVLLGGSSGIMTEQMARGKSILISPYYFADNLTGLADTVASAGTPALQSTLQKIKESQGWPLSLVASTGKIGEFSLTPTEQQLVQKLAAEGIVKPPTISFGNRTESFLFTPKPGNARLNAANREIYERAMALISAVRKGQLLPKEIRIRSPLAILRALRRDGFLGSNSEAADQYRNLVVLKVAYLHETVPGRWQLHLHKTPENERALDLAIELLQEGTVSNMEVNEEARLALSKGEEYIQSLISASELKKREKQLTDPQAIEEFEQLVMQFD